MSVSRWLHSGLHLKCWLAVLAVAIAVLSLGFGYLLKDLYQTVTFPAIVGTLTLQF